MRRPTAVLIDGDFFLRRYRYLKGNAPPHRVALDLHWMAREHLKQEKRAPQRALAPAAGQTQ